MPRTWRSPPSVGLAGSGREHRRSSSAGHQRAPSARRACAASRARSGIRGPRGRVGTGARLPWPSQTAARRLHRPVQSCASPEPRMRYSLLTTQQNANEGGGSIPTTYGSSTKCHFKLLSRSPCRQTPSRRTAQPLGPGFVLRDAPPQRCNGTPTARSLPAWDAAERPHGHRNDTCHLPWLLSTLTSILLLDPQKNPTRHS